MEVSLTAQPPENLLGAFPGVDDAQDLLQPLEFPGQLCVCQLARPPEGHPPEGVPCVLLHGAQLLRGELRGKFPEDGTQCGLCGGAQHSRGSIVLHQLSDGPHAGTQIGQRQHLRLVKDDHAPGQIVELSALGGAAGVQRLKELNGCGHNHRHVPGLSGPGHADGFRGGLLADVIEDAGVVLQHMFRP